MEDVKELIGNFSAAVADLQNSVKELNEKFDSILSGADAAFNDWDHNKKISAFSERNKDFLNKYSDKLKKIEGDDFDLAEETFKNLDHLPEGMDEAGFIAALSASIDDQIQQLRDALNADVVEAEVKENTEGEAETEIKADGETVAEVEKPEEESNADEEESESESETEDEAEPEDNSPEEIEALKKELEGYK